MSARCAWTLSKRQGRLALVDEGAGGEVVEAVASGGLTVVAVGPVLDAVMEATAPRRAASLGATVLYASTIRPFDGAGLRAAVSGTDVVLVEPYLEGTSAAEVSSALSDRPYRLLSIGVPNTERRKYGTAAEHNEAHGLDAAARRARIGAWLGGVTVTPDRWLRTLARTAS